MRDTLDITFVCEHVLKLARATMKGSDVELINEVPADIANIVGDEQRIIQIMTNLVNNASKFTFVGSISLGAKMRNNGKMLEISCTDTGIGIPKDKQNIVFQALRQVDEAADRKYGGVGLGLAISKDLAQAMGGRLEL